MEKMEKGKKYYLHVESPYFKGGMEYIATYLGEAAEYSAGETNNNILQLHYYVASGDWRPARTLLILPPKFEIYSQRRVKKSNDKEKELPPGFVYSGK